MDLKTEMLELLQWAREQQAEAVASQEYESFRGELRFIGQAEAYEALKNKIKGVLLALAYSGEQD